MRFALVLGVLGACSSSSKPSAPPKDAAPAKPPADAAPAADLPPHREVADLATAIRELVTDDVRVVAFGELHARVDRPSAAASALVRFSDEVLPVIGARLSDLVLETWLFDRNCGEQAQTATAKVEATMQRPPATKSELATLVDRARAAGVRPHVMRLTCDDWTAVSPPGKDIDYEAMLSIITRELGRIATDAVAYRDKEKSPRTLVATYGGALHNDLYPIEGIADWSFAKRVDGAAPGRYLEVDLYVPEYAELDTLSQQEPWFPLVAAARSDRVTVIERGPRSYILLLPRTVTNADSPSPTR
jgi:hypothetical protein